MLAPPGEYDEVICVAATTLAIAAITVAICSNKAIFRVRISLK